MNLTEKEQQLQSVNVELTALYGRVFDGPTECTSKSHSPPGREPWVCVFHAANTLLITIAFIAFPEDDRLEYDLHAEEKRYDQIQASLNSESRAAENLARAVRFMDACQSSMQEALGYSRYGPLHSYCVFPLYHLLTSGIDLKICGEVESVFYACVLESRFLTFFLFCFT